MPTEHTYVTRIQSKTSALQKPPAEKDWDPGHSSRMLAFAPTQMPPQTTEYEETIRDCKELYAMDKIYEKTQNANCYF